MALILLRHTTPRVPEGTCYGRTDLDLADTFKAEAQHVLQTLPPVARILSSPLQRCRRLAETIARARELPLRIEPKLAEMDFGAWEGRLWSDIPRAELDQWAIDFLHARPHGGESVAALRDRVRASLAPWRHLDEPVLAVTHAGVIRAALAKGETASDFNTQVDFGAFISVPTDQGDTS